MQHIVGLLYFQFKLLNNLKSHGNRQTNSPTSCLKALDLCHKRSNSFAFMKIYQDFNRCRYFPFTFVTVTKKIHFDS